MKKIYGILLVPLIACTFFGQTIVASALSKKEIENKITTTETRATDFISKLTTWSNNYKDDLRQVITKQFISDISSKSFGEMIDYTISKLNAKGLIGAANELLKIKTDIVNNSDKIKETVNSLENYLVEHQDEGLYSDNVMDVLLKVRSTFNNLKPDVKNLVNIYYNSYYNELSNKVQNATVSRNIIDTYYDVLDKVSTFDTSIAVLDGKLDTWQSIYNGYEIPEEMVKSFGSSYYNKINTDYYKLYNKIETKLQTILDDKATDIVNSNVSNKANGNKEIYDLIDDIRDIRSESNSKFYLINNKIKIALVKEYANKYEQEILDRLEEAINYTEENYILDIFELDNKYSAEDRIFDINSVTGFLTYDMLKTSLLSIDSSLFLNKIDSNYSFANLFLENIYNGRVGTGTVIKAKYGDNVIATYTIVVKGDCNKDGLISSMDYIKIRNHIMENGLLTENIVVDAADSSNDGKISAMDYVNIKNQIMNGDN